MENAKNEEPRQSAIAVDSLWQVFGQGAEDALKSELNSQKDRKDAAKDLLDAGLIQHGRSYWARDIQSASLDHAIWFHGDCRADQWLLHTADLERNSGGRTLVRGRFYTREGSHVATLMQQGLMRLR